MVYDDGKGVYYTAKDKYGQSVLRIPPKGDKVGILSFHGQLVVVQ